MKQIGFAAGFAWWFTFALWSDAFAQGALPDPNVNCPPAQCGQVSPLIPMQSAEAVHMGTARSEKHPSPRSTESASRCIVFSFACRARQSTSNRRPSPGRQRSPDRGRR